MLLNRHPAFAVPWIANPWRILDEFQKQLVQDNSAPGGVRLWDTEGQVVLEIDAPGRTEDQFDVSLQGDQLQVTAPARVAVAPAEARPIRMGRATDAVDHRFRLAFPITADRVEAQYSGGVLRLIIKKPESVQPTKVTVRAG